MMIFPTERISAISRFRMVLCLFLLVLALSGCAKKAVPPTTSSTLPVQAYSNLSLSTLEFQAGRLSMWPTKDGSYALSFKDNFAAINLCLRTSSLRDIVIYCKEFERPELASIPNAEEAKQRYQTARISPSPEKRMALAIMLRDTPLLDAALQSGANPNTPMQRGEWFGTGGDNPYTSMPPLIFLVTYLLHEDHGAVPYLDYMERLLTKGADPSRVSTKDVMEASFSGKVQATDIRALLVKHGWKGQEEWERAAAEKRAFRASEMVSMRKTGAQICAQTTAPSRYTITGFTENYANGKLQIRIAGVTMSGDRVEGQIMVNGVAYSVGAIVWDTPDGWSLCPVT